MLQPSEATKHALGLYRMMGDRAEAVAARRAREHEAAGEREEAENWTMIRRIIRGHRGPNET